MPERKLPSKRRLHADLVAALAPLHSIARTQLLMNTALSRTAQYSAQQVVVLFVEAAQNTSDPTKKKSLQNEADDEIQKAFDDLDKSDPFGTGFGGKAGFGGKGANFPFVCYKTWKEQMRNFVKGVVALEDQLRKKGDPDAHQHAIDAFKDRMNIATESLSRCLRAPQPLKPLPE